MLRLLEATMRRSLGRREGPSPSGPTTSRPGASGLGLQQYTFRVDLHVHRDALCSNGGPPKATEVAGLMERRGLAGLVVTAHDALPDRVEIDAVNRGLPRGMRIYSGVEVGTSEGHCLVVGLPSLEGISSGLSTWELVKRADQHRAAVILVHPLQPTPLTPRPVAISDMAPGIHAVEIMSTVTRSTQELEARLFAHERGWIMVAGSDALSPLSVGAAFCTLPRLPADEADLASLIRAGTLRPERGD